jgi:hypothetical protein
VGGGGGGLIERGLFEGGLNRQNKVESKTNNSLQGPYLPSRKLVESREENILLSDNSKMP